MVVDEVEVAVEKLLMVVVEDEVVVGLVVMLSRCGVMVVVGVMVGGGAIVEVSTMRVTSIITGIVSCGGIG